MLVLTLGSPGVAVAQDPVEGFWNFNGGVVQVKADGSGFSGVIVKQTTFSGCPHPVGERMWRMDGSGGTYTGTHSGFSDTTTCAPEAHPARWTVSGDSLTFEASKCREAIGTCGVDTFTLTRNTEVTSKDFLWSVAARYEAPGGATSELTGPLGGSLGVVNVAGDRVSGGQGATIRITDRRRAGAPAQRLVMRTRGVGGPFSATPGGGGRLELLARITSSQFSNCEKGTNVFLLLVDGAGAKPDVTEFRGCGVKRVYRSNRADMRVKVTIGERV